MSQPIIGITMALNTDGSIRPDVDYSYIRYEYGEQVRDAGGQPIFLDSTIDPAVAARICDGIVISGGEDVDPSIYGAELANEGGNIEPIKRTLWERELIDACDWAGVPILGVCYGSQLLNAHYGGSLYQHLERDHSGALNHHGIGAESEMHEVVFENNFLGFQKGDTATTAHRHHQAVNELAPDFSVIARAPDGVIEAIAGHNHYGIQWHAESDGTAGRIYSAFVTNCGAVAQPHTLTDLLPESTPEIA